MFLPGASDDLLGLADTAPDTRRHATHLRRESGGAKLGKRGERVVADVRRRHACASERCGRRSVIESAGKLGLEIQLAYGIIQLEQRRSCCDALGLGTGARLRRALHVAQCDESP